MEKFVAYAEEHPWLVGGVTLGGVFLLLWLFGFFGSSSSSNQGGNNLAAAYYAAEAAQTTAGAQLQMATVAYGAQTAQAGIQADAAQGIAKTQAGMATTLGQQQAGVAINSQNDALSAAQAAYAAQYNTALQAGYAAEMNNYISSIVATEAASHGGVGAFVFNPAQGIGATNVTGGAYDPAGFLAEGYSPSGAALQLGVPLTSIA